MRSQLFFILSLFFLAGSCNKESLKTRAPSLIGNWKHYSSESSWEYLFIDENGEGRIEWYTNSKLHKDTKVKSWYVKDNRLYFGKTTFSLEPFDITTYPTISGQDKIIGWDTLTAGNRYLGLDDQNYVEFE